MDPSIKVSSINGPRVLVATEPVLVLVLVDTELALVAMELVLAVTELVRHQATNPRHTAILATVQALVSHLPSIHRLPMEALVDTVPQAQLVLVVPHRTIHRRSNHQDTVLVQVQVQVLAIQDQPASEVKDTRRFRPRPVRKVPCKRTQPMLKVSSKILTHRSSVARQQEVFKPTHKTSKFAFSNRHPSHHQA